MAQRLEAPPLATVVSVATFAASACDFSGVRYGTGVKWHAWAQKPFHWDIGGYAGKYYDTDPGKFVQGNVRLRNHHVVALTGSSLVKKA